MAAIFISHSVKDHHIAGALVKLLRFGLGVPVEEIFCSTGDDTGITTGADFNKYMRDELNKNVLFIALYTPTYVERPICMMELGSAWAKEATIYPIVVPPLDYSKITETIGQRQSKKLDDPKFPTDLKAAVCSLPITFINMGNHAWDNEKDAFKDNLSDLLAKVEGSFFVPKSELVEACEKLIEAEQRIATLEKDKVDLLSKTITPKPIAAPKGLNEPILPVPASKTHAIKVYNNTNKMVADYDSKNSAPVQDKFDNYIKKINASKPSWMSEDFFIKIILNHFGKEGFFGEYSRNNSEQIQSAVDYNLMSDDGEYTIYWNDIKLRNLTNNLDQLKQLLDTDDAVDLKLVRYSINDRAFWEDHL